MRFFLHKFIKFGITVLYDEFVVAPVHVFEAHTNMNEYSKAGFAGCVGSTDCSHIANEKCNLKNIILVQRAVLGRSLQWPDDFLPFC